MRKSPWPWLALAFLLLVVAGVSYCVYAVSDALTKCSGLQAGQCRNAALVDADHTPRWSAQGDYIVANVGADIYVVHMPDGEVRPLPKAKEGVHRVSPTLSRDGRVAYIRYKPNNGRYMTFQQTNIDGGKDKTVATRDGRSIAAISPDGSKLFYLRRGSPSRAEAVMLSDDGESVVHLPGYFHDQRAAVWSPDSSGVALLWESDERPKGFTLSFIDWDGRNETVLARSGFRISVPGWTRDGQLYYAERDFRGRSYGALLYAIDEGERRLVADLTTLEAASPHIPTIEGEIYQVKPSPDGERVLVFGRGSDEWPTSGHRIYSVGDGVVVARLPTRSIRAPLFASWSPDGESVAVYDTAKRHLFITSRDGVHVRSLRNDGPHVLWLGSPAGR